MSAEGLHFSRPTSASVSASIFPFRFFLCLMGFRVSVSIHHYNLQSMQSLHLSQSLVPPKYSTNGATLMFPVVASFILVNTDPTSPEQAL